MHPIQTNTVFSLNFSSVGKGPFIAGIKGKKYAPKVTFPGGRRVVECRTWPCPFWAIYKLSSLKCHSLILRPILHKSATVTFTLQFQMIDSNNFTLSSMFSFQNAWPIKRKVAYNVYFSTFNIFIHFLVACEDGIGSQLVHFLKVLL